MNLNWILFIIGTCSLAVVLSGTFWYFRFEEKLPWKRTWYFRFKEKWVWKRTSIFFCAWILVALCSICVMLMLFLLNRQSALIQREVEEKVKFTTNAYFPPLIPPGSFLDAFGLLGAFVAVLFVCGGIWLIGSTKHGRGAKVAGATMLVAGSYPFYLTGTIKLEKLFDLEAKTELTTVINADLGNGGWFGAEPLIRISPFEKGERYLEGMSSTSSDEISMNSGNSLARDFEVMCEAFASHGQTPTLVMIIGSTDPSPLRRGVRQTFGSNFGLARARAEWVKSQWETWEREKKGSHSEACNVPDENFMTLGSGPSFTPELRGRRQEDWADDRRVEIWALWGAQKQEESKNPKVALKFNSPEIHLGDTSEEKDGETK